MTCAGLAQTFLSCSPMCPLSRLEGKGRWLSAPIVKNCSHLQPRAYGSMFYLKIRVGGVFFTINKGEGKHFEKLADA